MTEPTSIRSTIRMPITALTGYVELLGTRGHTLAYSADVTANGQMLVKAPSLRYLTDELKAKVPSSL